MPNLLELENVTKIFGGGIFNRSNVTIAVHDVTLAIPEERPTITAIAGESGSGKTTLARLLLGVLSPTNGTVSYQGLNIEKMRGSEWITFRREVQPIFQDPFEAYNPFYTVDHVLNRPIRNFRIGNNKVERQDRINEALRMVGLQPEETLGRYPHQLSGGQRQRVMVARALVLQPRIILADEPVSMVDASLRATILRSIRDLNRELGISVIYITHDLTTAYQMCDNIIVMYRGSVVEAGSVDQVIRNPKHPYTQLLIDSVPQPDPKIAWGDEETTAERVDEASTVTDQCKFAPRCPYAMETCTRAIPPLYSINQHQLSRCYLYEDSPTTQNPDIGHSFEYPNIQTPTQAT